MRLRDLDAQFIGNATATEYTRLDSDTVHGAQGVLFQCPKCAEGKERGEEDGRRFVRGAHYVRVYFSNPHGASVAPPEAGHNPRWQMSGSTLDDLTLSPSINLDDPQGDGSIHVDRCRWHGFVRNGDAS